MEYELSVTLTVFAEEEIMFKLESETLFDCALVEIVLEALSTDETADTSLISWFDNDVLFKSVALTALIDSTIINKRIVVFLFFSFYYTSLKNKLINFYYYILKFF